MAFCTQCGSHCADGSAFCSSCGKALGVGAQATTAPKNESVGMAQEHLKQAATSALKGAQELSKVPNFPLKATMGLSMAGCLVYLLPWANIFFFSISGIKLGFSPDKFGYFVLMLNAIPAAFLLAAYLAWAALKNESLTTKHMNIVSICGAVAFVVQCIAHVVASEKAHGMDVFTVWFYLEYLLSAALFSTRFLNKLIAKQGVSA